MTLYTLRSMASGGIYDQVGGGFSRYAVDATWTVPHFEKMLYDNALLARAYLHGWQVTGDDLLRRTAEETLDWAIREMRAPEGGFYSALDADSEGVEGKFYVWTLDELRAALGDDSDAAVAWFGASEAGNFEGANVLESRGPEPPAEVRERIRARLLEVRAAAGAAGPRRQAPRRLERADDRGAGRGRRRARAVRPPRRRARAPRAFVLDRMRDPDGRLLRTFNAGEARLNAYLEDHAFVLEALLTLYEATFEERWFAAAREIADTIVDRFADPDQRRLLLDLRRPRGARRAAQGPRGRPDPVGRLGGGVRAPAARGADRRGALRGPRRVAPAPAARDRAAPPDGVRASAAGDRLPPGAGSRGRARRRARRGRRARGRGAVRVPPARRARGRRGRRRLGGAADGGPHAGRRARGGVRVRALRLPAAGDVAGRARARCWTPETAVRAALHAARHTICRASHPARGIVSVGGMGMDDLTSIATRSRRTRRRPAIAGAVVVSVGALFAPAAAHAAAMTVTGTCFASGQQLVVSGTAFSPGGTVAIGGGSRAPRRRTRPASSRRRSPRPRSPSSARALVTVTALDQANPANIATMQVKVVRRAFGSNLPVAGRPTRSRRGGSRGSRPGADLRALPARRPGGAATTASGSRRATAGTLSARAARIPGVRALEPGRWTIRLDQRMTYREGTPGSVARFNIVRRR